MADRNSAPFLEDGGWLGRRAEEVMIGGAGLALALALILPFG